MNRRSLFKSIIGAAIAPEILDAESVAKKPGFLVQRGNRFGKSFDPLMYVGEFKWINIPLTLETQPNPDRFT